MQVLGSLPLIWEGPQILSLLGTDHAFVVVYIWRMSQWMMGDFKILTLNLILFGFHTHLFSLCISSFENTFHPCKGLFSILGVMNSAALNLAMQVTFGMMCLCILGICRNSGVIYQVHFYFYRLVILICTEDDLIYIPTNSE